MTDIVDTSTRSRMMSGITSKDTRPEMIVRKGLFRKGFRYRLHSSALPGKPDLVLRKYNALILVNGCFWHGHLCHLFRVPRTSKEFWRNKIDHNRERDGRNLRLYRKLGWRVPPVLFHSPGPPPPDADQSGSGRQTPAGWDGTVSPGPGVPTPRFSGCHREVPWAVRSKR